MKRLVSILVIATMLFASVMAMIPASADTGVGGGEPPVPPPAEPAPNATYNVNWKALHDANKMQCNWSNEIRGYGATSEFAELYTITVTDTSIVTGLNPDYKTFKKADGTTDKYSGYEQRTYFSAEMFAISETTSYELVISSKLNRKGGYAGLVFACDAANYPYFVYGAFDNQSDTAGKSELRVRKGVHGTSASQNEKAFLTLLTDTDGYGTIKVVYEGYNVSFYGLVAEDKWEEFGGMSITLPKGAKVAPGVFNRDSDATNQRTINAKNAVITGWNNETAAIMNGESAAKIALAASIDVADKFVLSDYTEDTAEALDTALQAGVAAYADDQKTDDELTAAKTAIDDAVAALVAKKADKSELLSYICMVEVTDTTTRYNQVALKQWLVQAEAAMANEDILNSEVDALVDALDDIPEVTPISDASDFAAMEADGNYVLTADIELTASYNEFKGYLNGNGHTITVTNVGVFNTLNGAEILDLTIKGSIALNASVGALATNAYGDITVMDVTNDATITVNSSGKNVAGFIANGKGTNIDFINCVNNADITGGRTSGFYADTNSGTNNLYFYNCVNFGDISCGASVNTNPASAFVARSTDGTTNMTFKYCANFGDIVSKYSVGAFFALGKGSVDIYGCVNMADVTAGDTNSTIRPYGGFVGGAKSNETCNITIDASAQVGNVTITKNYSGVPAALLAGSAGKGKISISNTYISGKVTSVDNNVYKITASADATIENVFVDDVKLMSSKIEDTDNIISGSGTPEDPYVYGTKTDVNPNAVDTTKDTDFDAYDEVTLTDMQYALVRFVYGAASTKVDEKINKTYAWIDAIEQLLTKEAVALMDAKTAALASLGEVEDDEGYTKDSYNEYVDAYFAVIEAIDAAADADALAAINVAELKAAAEAKLVTTAAADAAADAAAAAAAAAAFAEAKANALIILSAKRENTNNVFTAASYAEYATAFDAIVASINGAADMAALKAIDIAALKVAAEAKLAVAVPEAPAADGEKETDAPETDAPATEATNDETQAPAKGGCGGCGSSAAISAIAIVGVIGTAIALKKKED